MLTSARPIFEHVPAAFADPVGLADQQAPGVVSLIVVSYPGAAGDPGPDDALGPVYDAYVAVSGGLLTVARTTADYRYPVAPSVALARFIAHRDGGRPASLSLYELSEADCTRFVETVYFSECLKVHVDGAASAQFVARQIARSRCAGGILEVNDFSDPEHPRVRLVDLADCVSSLSVPAGLVSEEASPDEMRADQAPLDTEPADETLEGETLESGAAEHAPADGAPDSLQEDALADMLAGLLDGVRGRVLLFDRAKNHAALPHRSGRPFDLLAAVEEANRLATARRAAPDVPVPASATMPADQVQDAAEAEEQVEAVETVLRGRRPRPDAPEHPHAQGLAVLVAELQGRGRTATPVSSAPGPTTAPAGVDAPLTHPLAATPVEAAPFSAPPFVATPFVATPLAPLPFAAPLADAPSPFVPFTESSATETPFLPDAPRTPASAPTGPSPFARHVLATELDVLRADVYALVEDAVGRDRAVPHEAHVLEVADIPTPVPAERTIDYLRALLCEDPPKRWHFFKRSRGKTYEVVCGKLLAFHAANGHVDSPVVHEVNKLWARLCS